MSEGAKEGVDPVKQNNPRLVLPRWLTYAATLVPQRESAQATSQIKLIHCKSPLCAL
jgi:hypothetical protein